MFCLLYTSYVRDTTEELKERRAKERLEQYFQTAVKYLPGGMAVIRHDAEGNIKPEYLSEGFSEMLDMPHEDAWAMYQENALALSLIHIWKVSWTLTRKADSTTHRTASRPCNAQSGKREGNKDRLCFFSKRWKALIFQFFKSMH